jgi:HAD superfamily hydrolase (TIGR01490 family)
MKIAAFFDLDRTLLSVNSGALWVQRERRLGRITYRQLIDATLMLLAYRLSMVNIEVSTRKALSHYKGVREEAMKQWTQEWYDQEIVHQVAPGALDALEEHRSAGHLLILLTTSSPYLARVVAKHLVRDSWISSNYEVKDGTFTGEPVLPICYGAGKVRYAESYARQAEVDLNSSYFYTDSFTDLPMLLRVGQPRVVNPDFRLKWYAHWRGWPILDWKNSSNRSKHP